MIVGGESGPRKRIRPMNIQWARDIRDSCRAAGTPFFFKQWGQHDHLGEYHRLKHFDGYNLLDGQSWTQRPDGVAQ